MGIIDTHAHLDHIEDLDQSLKTAVKEDVEGIVAVSVSLESSKKTLEISKRINTPKIYPALGIHPSDIVKDDLGGLKKLITDYKEDLYAVGEIGLDYWYKDVRNDERKKEEQRYVFRTLLNVAYEFNLPAIIHSRGAWKDAYDIVCDVGIKKAVFHWYDGPFKVLDQIMKKGYFISTTPNLLYNENLRSLVERIDRKQLLLETDSPVYFLNRRTDEGFVAEPRDVWRTLRAYCSLMRVSEEVMVNVFNTNAKYFFNLNKGES